MTEKEKFAIAEQKEAILNAYSWTCQICDRPANQLAHRIAQTKSNIRKYGKHIIHHWLNLLPVCSLKCNDACNIGFKPYEVSLLVKDILATPSILSLDNPREYIK